MLMGKIKGYLDGYNVKYDVIAHMPTYTASETAQSAHIVGKAFAKTVIVKCGKQMVMAVLPASAQLDLDVIKEVTGSDRVVLAKEFEFCELFPECEVGAMPPFGNLFNLNVYVDEQLALQPEIAFNAGEHTDLIKLAYQDFEKLVDPVVLNLAR